MNSGYSKISLVRKLGIKPGNKILLLNSPSHYLDLLSELPPDVTVVDEESMGEFPFIHLFVKDSKELYKYFSIAKNRLAKDGMLWVSWIKKSSKLETDISESDVRILGLDIGLVDVKICAVDEDWSGLKFMYRKKDR